MPPHSAVGRLLDLDKSSNEFRQRLPRILDSQECMNHAQNLLGNDLSNFVDGLDYVRVLVILIHPPLNGDTLGHHCTFQTYRADLPPLSF
jgi:hypothetical protein